MMVLYDFSWRDESSGTSVAVLLVESAWISFIVLVNGVIGECVVTFWPLSPRSTYGQTTVAVKWIVAREPMYTPAAKEHYQPDDMRVFL